MFQNESTDRILRGYSQVILQNNTTTGLLFLVAIFLGTDFYIFIGSLLGCYIATLFALNTNKSITDVNNGIYGFNGVLIGIATATFFSEWFIILSGIVLGSIASVYVLDSMKSKKIPFLTFPFILITCFILVANYFAGFSTLENATLFGLTEIKGLKAIATSFSQVFLVNNQFSGYLIIAGLLISMRLKLAYTIVGVAVCIVLSDLIFVPKYLINNGLVGYNVILCAALFANKAKALLYVFAAAFLCVVLQWLFNQYELIALTAPFVFTSWIIEYIDTNLIKAETD